MIHNCMHWLTFATLGIATPLSFGQTADGVSSFSRSTIRLTSAPFPDAVVDEQTYMEWIDRRGRQLDALADRTSDNDLQRRYRIAAVNWSLAKRCEPALSRMLNNVPHPTDAGNVRDIATASLKSLKELRKSLDDDPPRDQALAQSNDDSDDEDAENDEADASREISLVDAADMLTAFARAFESLAGNASENDIERIDAAALDLSFYIEDERSDVAASALLWQAYLYAHSGRPERALRILPRVMSQPRRAALFHDTFARLLRCRYLIERGAHATAWAMLLAIEERSHDWFQSPRAQADAARSAILLKLAVCDNWPNAANESEREPTASWCRSTTGEIQKEHFGDTNTATLLRLESAIPLVIQIPDAELPEIERPAPSESGDGS